MQESWIVAQSEQGSTMVQTSYESVITQRICSFWAIFWQNYSGTARKQVKMRQLMSTITRVDTHTATMFLQQLAPLSQQTLLAGPRMSSSPPLRPRSHPTTSKLITVVTSMNLKLPSIYTNYLKTTGTSTLTYLCTSITCYNQNNILMKEVCPDDDDAVIRMASRRKACVSCSGRVSATMQNYCRVRLCCWVVRNRVPWVIASGVKKVKVAVQVDSQACMEVTGRLILQEPLESALQLQSTMTPSISTCRLSPKSTLISSALSVNISINTASVTDLMNSTLHPRQWNSHDRHYPVSLTGRPRLHSQLPYAASSRGTRYRVRGQVVQELDPVELNWRGRLVQVRQWGWQGRHRSGTVAKGSKQVRKLPPGHPLQSPRTITKLASSNCSCACVSAQPTLPNTPSPPHTNSSQMATLTSPTHPPAHTSCLTPSQVLLSAIDTTPSRLSHSTKCSAPRDSLWKSTYTLLSMNSFSTSTQVKQIGV